MIVFGVPVLSRYDLLENLLRSAEDGDVKPDLYLIVDNGGRFSPAGSESVQRAISRGARLEILSVGANMGVSASWNRILERAAPHPAIISNDDIVLGAESIAVLSEYATSGEEKLVIADGGADANGWCLFAQTSKIFETVGAYDESFYPAYYEDSDYRRRMALRGFVPVSVQSKHTHLVRGSQNDVVREGLRQSLDYFERKWGGHPNGETFSVPFDGAPVEWQKRDTRGEWKQYAPSLKRWDIVNYLLQRYDEETSYLEIGVSGGESMRNVRADLKVGVDPEPQVEGVRACDLFFCKTSNWFFENWTEMKYSVVFVDGLHHADQAYEDIQNACLVSDFVVVHDCNPTTEAMQQIPYRGGEWTGDVWKAMARIRSEGVHTVRTVNTDYGCGIVIAHRPDAVVTCPRETWQDLQAHRADLLGLIPVTNWQSVIEDLIEL